MFKFNLKFFLPIIGFFILIISSYYINSNQPSKFNPTNPVLFLNNSEEINGVAEQFLDAAGTEVVATPTPIIQSTNTNSTISNNNLVPQTLSATPLENNSPTAAGILTPTPTLSPTPNNNQGLSDTPVSEPDNPTPIQSEPTPTPTPMCAQVVTRACIQTPATGAYPAGLECRDFPTPCDVPDGWEINPPSAATP